MRGFGAVRGISAAQNLIGDRDVGYCSWKPWNTHLRLQAGLIAEVLRAGSRLSPTNGSPHYSVFVEVAAASQSVIFKTSRLQIPSHLPDIQTSKHCGPHTRKSPIKSLPVIIPPVASFIHPNIPNIAVPPSVSLQSTLFPSLSLPSPHSSFPIPSEKSPQSPAPSPSSPTCRCGERRPNEIASLYKIFSVAPLSYGFFFFFIPLPNRQRTPNPFPTSQLSLRRPFSFFFCPFEPLLRLPKWKKPRPPAPRARR